jgi:hypothetical protein
MEATLVGVVRPLNNFGNFSPRGESNADRAN